MPCQAKTEPLDFLHLTTVQIMRDAEKMLYDFLGYRGTFATTGDSARLNVDAPDAVPVNVSLGDVIVFRANPMAIVSTKSWDEFNATFDII